LQPVRPGLHRPLSVAALRGAAAAGPAHARDLSGSRHRPALCHRRQWRPPDGATPHRADPGTPAGPRGTLTWRIARAASVPARALARGGANRAPAPELDDIAVRPTVSRFTLTEAFRRGGEAERTALEAELAPIPGADERAVQLGRDLDGDGDPDEIHFHLEVVEVQEEVFPGEFVTFWVFAPVGRHMSSPARLPSPTLRVEEGDRVAITLYNTHYLPHTIHLHGTAQDNNMDGVPHMTQHEVPPGKSFTYRFIAKNPGTYWYHCHVQEQAHVGMGLA